MARLFNSAGTEDAPPARLYTCIKMNDSANIISNPKLWAGLNKPNLPIVQADIVMFGIPFDGGTSFRASMRYGTQAIRNIT